MELKTKMSKEAFKEVIDNIELINNITLYGRIGIKQNVKKLWAEIKNLKADLYEANNIISDYIDITTKQEKMIELMALALAETEFDKCCDYCHTGVCTAHDDVDERAVCIKQYFEKKAEESE